MFINKGLRSMKNLLRFLAVLGLIFPWFFKEQLQDSLYLIVVLGYCAALGLNFIPPREKYWWWILIEHFAFGIGCALIATAVLLDINRSLGLIAVGAGLAIILFFGYSARMRLIGRPDPGLELFLELKGKTATRRHQREREK